MGNLENFKKLLSTLKEKIGENRRLYETNEQAVKMGLINPVLGFLEWDMENPRQVVPEDNTGGGRADYCLMMEDVKERGLFLEAKNMSKSTEEGLSGLQTYCTDSGVLYGISSNGKEWMLFRAFEQGKSRKERIVWKVDIINDPTEEVFAKLSQISREELPKLDARVRQAETVEGLIQRSLENLSPQVIRGICNAVRKQPEFEPLSCSNEELDTIVCGKLSSLFKRSEDTQIKEKTITTDKLTKPERGKGKKAPPRRPEAIVLFGKRIPIRFSYEILTVVASELVRKGALSQNKVPVHRGYACFLVNNTPKHPTGDKFKTPKEVGKGLWIEGHCSTEAAIDYAKKLLEHCGCNGKKDLKIIWK